MENQRYAIIIGAMKCGTSSLFALMTKHPQIIGSIIKEPEFFSPILRPNKRIHNYATYRELWPENLGVADPVLMEASTGYTKIPKQTGVAQRMHDYGIRPKLIYCVRNPIDRVASQYNFSLEKRFFAAGSKITDALYYNYSRYFTQLEPYRQTFGLHNIHIVDFDDIKIDARSVAQGLTRFLEIDGTFSFPIPERRNETRAVSQRAMRVYTSPRLSRYYWNLPRGPRNTLHKLYLKRGRKAPFAKLTQDQREFLYDELREDILRFGETFNFPVEKWGFV
ncbi:MAG: sulfotransferase domain-containing protein [Pseudomonadota bacterium]